MLDILLIVLSVGAIVVLVIAFATDFLDTEASVAIAGTVLIFCTLYFLWRSSTEEEALKKQSPADTLSETTTSSDAQVFRRMVERYGLGYEDLHLVYVIENDGAVRLKRTVQVLAMSHVEFLDTLTRSQNLTEADPELATLEAESAVELDAERFGDASDSVSGEEPRTDEEDSFDFVVRSLTEPYSIVLEDEKEDEESHISERSSLLHISPSLTAGARMRYELEEVRNKSNGEPLHSTFESLAALKSKRKPDPVFGYDEYFGWHVNRPTRRLVMEVIFPAGWRFETKDVAVLYANVSSFPTTQRQMNEREQVEFRGAFRSGGQSDPYDGRYFFRLEREYPMIGLIYAIQWRPVQGAARESSARGAD